MKKKYVKPQILFEDMTLNTSIAGCNNYPVTNCDYWNAQNDFYDGTPFYWSEMKMILIDGDDLVGSGCEMGYYCYDIPSKVALANQS